MRVQIKGRTLELLEGNIIRQEVDAIVNAANQLLASAYRRSLELAAEHGCRSLAFPSLGTGAYGYPSDQAAGIALGVVMDFLQSHDKPELVRFVLLNPATHEEFGAALQDLIEGQSGSTATTY